jgi:hypothetical protein
MLPYPLHIKVPTFCDDGLGEVQPHTPILSSAPSSQVSLTLDDQDTVTQLIKRLRKNFQTKDGMPVSNQIIKAALGQLLEEL